MAREIGQDILFKYIVFYLAIYKSVYKKGNRYITIMGIATHGVAEKRIIKRNLNQRKVKVEAKSKEMPALHCDH